MPVLPRRRDKIGQPVEELKRRELDDAVGSRPRGLAAATPPDPVGRLVSRQHVADLTPVPQRQHHFLQQKRFLWIPWAGIDAPVFCFMVPDLVGIKVYCPEGEGTFGGDEMAEEAPT